MTFVTNVPCAHVIQIKKRLFFYSDIFPLRAHKGQWRQNYERGAVIPRATYRFNFRGYRPNFANPPIFVANFLQTDNLSIAKGVLSTVKKQVS